MWLVALLEGLRGHRRYVVLSLLMAMAEAAGQVVLPFLIGIALGDYLDGSLRGLMLLASVGVVTMLVAVGRRFHDSRQYARIYEKLAADGLDQDAGLSENTARLNMLREVADFLEYSMPMLIANLGAFAGTLAFLAALSMPVFIGALLASAVIVAIYAATTRHTVELNSGYNDEYERQVDVLRRNDRARIQRHVGLLNRWSIRLSDVDAINNAISLTLMIALQVFAVISMASRELDEGTVLSVVLYVYTFSATAPYLPESWQEYLRFREILERQQAAEEAESA